MNMKNQSNKIALVTGASSGIGQATAELLTNAGYTVYGTSRRGGGASRGRVDRAPIGCDLVADQMPVNLWRGRGCRRADDADMLAGRAQDIP